MSAAIGEQSCLHNIVIGEERKQTPGIIVDDNVLGGNKLLRRQLTQPESPCADALRIRCLGRVSLNLLLTPALSPVVRFRKTSGAKANNNSGDGQNIEWMEIESMTNAFKQKLCKSDHQCTSNNHGNFGCKMVCLCHIRKSSLSTGVTGARCDAKT